MAMKSPFIPLFKGENPKFSLHERKGGRDFKAAK